MYLFESPVGLFELNSSGWGVKEDIQGTPYRESRSLSQKDRNGHKGSQRLTNRHKRLKEQTTANLTVVLREAYKHG